MQRTIKNIQKYFRQALKFIIDEDGSADNSLQFPLRSILLLVLYILLDKTLRGITNLPIGIYFDPVIYFGFLKHIFFSKYFILLPPIILFLILFRKRLLCEWIDFGYGKSVRFFIVLTSGILAWVFSTYDFNLYFNQAHIADRLLLITLTACIYWRPVFVLPFLTVLLPIIGQFEALAGFSWATPYLPIHILILFSAFYLFYSMTKKFPIINFVIFIGSLFAAHYWFSGSGKFNFEWILYDQIYFLMPATYATGWLGFWEPQIISDITQKFAYFNLPLKIFTLIVECGSCFFFLHRKLPRFFLISWVILHLGIFATSGICFWTWILLDLGLLFLFYQKQGFADFFPLNKTQIIVSIALIISSAYWCRPVKLAWQDVPMSYTYRFEGETESGETVILPPAFFAPYDYQFTLSGFGYLTDQKLLPIVWGASNAATAQRLRKANNIDELFTLEQSEGLVYYHKNSADQFYSFIKQFVSNWNNHLSKNTMFSAFAPPRLLWTFPRNANIEINEKIMSVTVNQITSFYVNGQYSEIRSVPVCEIEIP